MHRLDAVHVLLHFKPKSVPVNPIALSKAKSIYKCSDAPLSVIQMPKAHIVNVRII